MMNVFGFCCLGVFKKNIKELFLVKKKINLLRLKNNCTF